MSDAFQVGGVRAETARPEPSVRPMMQRDRASAALGMVVEKDEPGESVVSMRVRDDMTNGFAITHGGLVFALPRELRHTARPGGQTVTE